MGEQARQLDALTAAVEASTRTSETLTSDLCERFLAALGDCAQDVRVSEITAQNSYAHTTASIQRLIVLVTSLLAEHRETTKLVNGCRTQLSCLNAALLASTTSAKSWREECLRTRSEMQQMREEFRRLLQEHDRQVAEYGMMRRHFLMLNSQIAALNASSR